MKLLSITLFAITIVGLFVFASCQNKEKNTENEAGEVAIASEESTAYLVDIEKSLVEWHAAKVTGEHHGTLKFAKGSLSVTNDLIKSGEFEFDMQSIVNLDLEDATWNEKLITHLISPDFFSVDSFPTAKFELVSATLAENMANETNYTIEGNLTIKGITHKISFPALVVIGDGLMNVKATMAVDRTMWNMKYNSGKFFPSIGDKMVNDEFDLKVDFFAKSE